jgi:hypothetical protein
MRRRDRAGLGAITCNARLGRAFSFMGLNHHVGTLQRIAAKLQVNYEEFLPKPRRQGYYRPQ